MKAAPQRAGGPLVAHGRAILGDLDAATPPRVAGHERDRRLRDGHAGRARDARPTTAGSWRRPSRRSGRRLLVGGLVERVTVGDRTVALDAHEFADGTIDGRGWELQESFLLDGSIPVWRFAIEDQIVERRVWMARGVEHHVRPLPARPGVAAGPARRVAP